MKLMISQAGLVWTWSVVPETSSEVITACHESRTGGGVNDAANDVIVTYMGGIKEIKNSNKS